MQINYYGLLRKLSPEALEQCYGIAGELLRGCCSDAPRLLERAYDALCKSRNAADNRPKVAFSTIKWDFAQPKTCIYGGADGFVRKQQRIEKTVVRIFRNRRNLFAESFFEEINEFRSSQTAFNYIALAVDNDNEGNTLDAKFHDGSCLPALQVAHVLPRHFPIHDSRTPSVAVGVKRHADYIDPTVFVTPVCLFQKGHFAHTGTAPAGPEIYDCELVFSNVGKQRNRVSGTVGKLEVGHLCLIDSLRGIVGLAALDFYGRLLFTLRATDVGVAA